MRGNSGNILIVDDDAGTRKSLTLILESKDYKVDTTVNGKDAIEKIKQMAFDIVLVDIKLPDMEGIDLVLMAKHINPAIGILVITGFPSLETAMRAVNEGATAYITKPLNMNEILSTIHNLIQRKLTSDTESDTGNMNKNNHISMGQKEQSVQHSAKIGKMINRISTRFIDSNPVDLENNIYLSLKEIAEFSKANNVWLVSLSKDTSRFEYIYWWNRQRNDVTLETSAGAVADDIWWIRKLKRHETITMQDISELPAGEELGDGLLQLHDTESLLMAPLVHMGGLIGFMGLGLNSKDELWLNDNSILLEQLGEIFQRILRLKSERTKKVLIGTGESIIGYGLSESLINGNLELTGTAGNAEELMRLVAITRPDVIIMSFKLSGENPRILIEKLKRKQPEVAVLMVCNRDEIRTRFTEAVRAGAGGCMPLDVSPEQLLAAVNCLSHGHAVGSVEAIKEVMLGSVEAEPILPSESPLNPREREILQMASTGMSNKNIAGKLGISERTVDAHLRSVFRKISVASRTEAIYKALKQRWIDL